MPRLSTSTIGVTSYCSGEGRQAEIPVSVSLCVCTNSWQKQKTKGWRPLGGEQSTVSIWHVISPSIMPRPLPPPSQPASVLSSWKGKAALSKPALRHHRHVTFLSSLVPKLGFALTFGSRLWPHLVFCVSVSGERPFQCRYCPYSASQKGNLKTHVQTVHRLAFDNAQYPDRRLRQAPTNEPTDPSGSHWTSPPPHDQLKWRLKSIKSPSKTVWCTNTAFKEDCVTYGIGFVRVFSLVWWEVFPFLFSPDTKL